MATSLPKVSLLVLAIATPALCEPNWPAFRGPTGQGITSETSTVSSLSSGSPFVSVSPSCRQDARMTRGAVGSPIRWTVTAAIGSTYNALAPVYLRLIDAFQKGDLEGSRVEQMHSIEFIRTLFRYPFHAAMKEVLGQLGIAAGPCRRVSFMARA